VAELVLALDLPDAEAATTLLDRLPGVRWVKLGSVLFTKAGPRLIESLKRRGLKVFLDLKWHDIPNTVGGAVRQARSLEVDLVTVHALGGEAMLAAAKDAAGSSLAVVAVTVLTSHDATSFGTAIGREVPALGDEVLRLARLAQRTGVDGVVSSARESAALRVALGPRALIVNPGIRAPGQSHEDQNRTATVAEAVAAGATHLVVGRPVIAAADPVAAWADLVAML